MVGKSFMQSTALAVLAAVGAMAVPAQAQDADQRDQQEQQEMPAPTRQERFERQVAAPEQRAERQAQRVERQAQRAERSQRAESQAATASQDPQATGGGRGWNRDDNGWQGRGEAQQEVHQQQGGASSDNDRQARILARQQERAAAAQQQGSVREGGWGSQRAPDGQRYGRNWDNGGTVTRPAPADNAATPSVPERGSVEQWRGRGEARDGADWANRRNRTYSDPNRNAGYVDQTNDRTAHDWRNQQGDSHGTYRDGYRDGGSAHSYRDWHDQNHDRNRYTSGSKDHRRWDRNNWRRDTRYNWSGYRNQHRDLYRSGRYYSPYNNYSYSRLSIGFFLNQGFYGQNYWINDPYQYRLPEVYGPYRWVRYYDDVLLVDIYSGEVVDVIHDFFW